MKKPHGCCDPLPNNTNPPLTPALIYAAYSAGYFPMAEDTDTPDVMWMDPPIRGIIPLDTFHISSSLRKFIKKNPFTVTINHAFETVITACAAPTPERQNSWINTDIKNVFIELHHLGHAHSFECWDKEGTFAGGLYGLAIHGAFFGESMVSRQSGASKIALVHLVHRLRARGFSLLDCQFVNDYLVQFGCIEISRDDYLGRLSTALSSTGVSLIDSSDPSSNMSSMSSSKTTSSSAVISCISSLDCF